MRPLSLAIEGFTAFRDRQEIDFEPLELFVITGPTGAGKTSILDAMVFALYGQVPRLGGKQGTSDLVSLGTVQARVQFEFSIDGKGRYRVARRLKRGAAQTATLERFEGETWVPACERGGVRECDRALTELLGLDYDSFCKAVVLPQGEFHRFLKGDPTERRKVLISLLGVSYFQRMGELARARQADLTSRVERTEEILTQQYAQATPEQVKELEEQSSTTAARSAALTTSLASAEGYARDAAEHDQRAEALGARAGELDALAATLRDQVEACRAAETATSAAASQLEAAAADLQTHRARSSDAEATVSQLQGESGTVDQLANAASAAETLRAAATEEHSAEAKLQGAQEAQAAAIKEVADAEQDDKDAEQRVTSAVAAEKERTATLEAATQRSRALEQQLDQGRNCENELVQARERLTTARTVFDGARAQAERARAALDQAVAHLEEHRRANAIAELADGLEPGDPCPVCGVSLSSAVAVATDGAEALSAAREHEHNARRASDQAASTATHAEASIDAAQEQQQLCERRLAETLDGHKDLTTLQLETEAATAASTAAADQLAEGRSAREAVQGEREQVHDRLLKARGALSRCEALTGAARDVLADVQQRKVRSGEVLTEHFGGKTPNDAAERIAGQRERLVAAMDAARVARAELDRAAETHQEARNQVDGAQRKVSDLDVELVRLRTQAETTGAATSKLLGDEVALGDIPGAAGGRDAATAQLASWCAESALVTSGVRDTAAQARASSEQHLLDIAAAHEIDAPSAERALALVRAAERAARDDALKAQSAAEEAARRASERQEMEQRSKEEREHIAILGDLALELRGDRFGEYIILETLDLLAVRASEELLRISDGRYSLVPVEGDFQVVDHANADEQRSVKTLSGGETFLASLALALALSRHVGDLATEGLGAKLEAVFIDEGFGSLDPETLDDVIDALERLRLDDLLIGVISHVPELAQRVRTGLEVRKLEGRSTIGTAGA